MARTMCCVTNHLKGRHIRVNVVSLGATRTPGLVGLAGDDADKQRGLLDFLSTRIPLGRVGEPEEIANAVLFLASDDASFVNGVEFFFDGDKRKPDVRAGPVLNLGRKTVPFSPVGALKFSLLVFHPP